MVKPRLIVWMPYGDEHAQILQRAEELGFQPADIELESKKPLDEIQIGPADAMLIHGDVIDGIGGKILQERVQFSSRSKLYLKVTNSTQAKRLAKLDLPISATFNGKDSTEDMLRKIKRDRQKETGLSKGMPLLFTRVGNKLKRIHLNDVDFIEVEGKYCAIVIGNRRFHVKSSMREMLQKLDPEQFVRVSRNYMINLERIEFIDVMQWTIRISDLDIPLSRTYKDDLMSRVTAL